ncbi:MAG: hypothetical protein WAK03_00965 [Methylocystis sp.]
MQLFYEQDVSFISFTQLFDTTSSGGCLMLNALVSKSR